MYTLESKYVECWIEWKESQTFPDAACFVDDFWWLVHVKRGFALDAHQFFIFDVDVFMLLMFWKNCTPGKFLIVSGLKFFSGIFKAHKYYFHATSMTNWAQIVSKICYLSFKWMYVRMTKRISCLYVNRDAKIKTVESSIKQIRVE